jgi:hypothetical protein
MRSVESYLKKTLIANGVGDIALGLMLLTASKQLSEWLGFTFTPELIYLSGAWGVAAVTFGLLRFFAGTGKNIQLQWFVAAFGLFEGGFLTCYGLFLTASTALTFFQVSLSTIFALVFFIAYLIAFMLRTK